MSGSGSGVVNIGFCVGFGVHVIGSNVIIGPVVVVLDVVEVVVGVGGSVSIESLQ